MGLGSLLRGDAEQMLSTLSGHRAQMCVTSPPYLGQRNYGIDGQIGCEDAPEAYVERMRKVFRELYRVLTDDGLVFMVLNDTYVGSHKGQGSDGRSHHNVGHKQKTNLGSVTGGISTPVWPVSFQRKSLGMVPEELISGLIMDGWILRSRIIWVKPNVFTESVKDRPTHAYETIFMLAKHPNYFYNQDERQEQGQSGPRNLRDVWVIPVEPVQGHHAVFPLELARRCIRLGSRQGDTIIDPFLGSGTAAIAAQELGREWIGIELNEETAKLAWERINEGA